jgi:hypothetical protein
LVVVMHPPKLDRKGLGFRILANDNGRFDGNSVSQS